MNGRELERYTYEVLGEPFIKAALRAPFDAGQEAREACMRFAISEEVNVSPIYIRGVQQTLLAGAAQRFGLVAVPEKAGYYWNYREITAAPADGGPSVVLTAARVPKPCAFKKLSGYQRGLAESGQGRLFGEIELGDSVYVMLLTSKYRGFSLEDARANRHLPGSVYLAWPSNECNEYVHVLNLVDRYSEIVDEYLPAQWNTALRLRYIEQTRRMAF